MVGLAAELSHETCIILGILIPAMLQMYVMKFVGRVTLVFVGHYDPLPEHIAGAALGTMYSNITGLSVGLGMSLALAPLCAQNVGSGALARNGCVLRQCCRAQAGCLAFALAAALFATPALRALDQPEEVLAPVEKFSLVSVAGLPAEWLSISISTILSCQHSQAPGVNSQVLGSAVQFCLTWALMAGGAGYLGVALASSVSSWVRLLYLVLWVSHAEKQAVVWEVSPDVLEVASVMSFKTYFKVALPSAISMWSEWWAAEILALFAGLLPGGQYSIAANGLLFNTLGIFYMTFLAMQKTASLRVSHHVGGKDIQRLKISIASAMCITAFMSVSVALLLHVSGPAILRLYTDETSIVDEAIRANLGMVLSIPPYAVMMCLIGTMWAAGLQTWTAVSVSVSFYIFGIPTSAYLGLLDGGWGLLGIWAGNVEALTLAALSMTWRTCWIDWSLVIKDASTSTPSDCFAPALSSPLLASTPVAEAMTPTVASTIFTTSREACS